MSRRSTTRWPRWRTTFPYTTLFRSYDLPELFYLDQSDIDDLREMSFTERDVEFTSDARREAIIYFDVVDDELTFRNVDGDWMVCDSAFDMSDTDVDYFYWN